MGKSAQDWLKSIDQRFKRIEKDWLKEARSVIETYECKDKSKTPFNILYSNTETILPSLYNSTPRPDVGRRFGSGSDQEDSVSHAASSIATRTLEYIADTNDGEYESFDECTRAATFSALLPGQGVARVLGKEDNGRQSICFESVAFDRFLWGYARSWKSVPWVAYGHDLDQSDFEATYPEAVKSDWYKNIDWKTLETDQANETKTNGQMAGEKPGAREPTLLVWEIWCWADRSIYHVTDAAKDSFVFEEPYPFALSTKFPSPEPLRFIKSVNDLTPIPLYRMYEAQAVELNELTTRMRKLAKAIKVRGVYNSSVDEFRDLFSDDNDNTLIPSQTASAFMDKGIEGNIWLVPIDMLVSTYQALATERESVKNSIYEIMGIGDLQRGQSDPGDGVGTNEIKNRWSTLRTKRSQRDVQIFCRDLFRISLEFASNLFSLQTFKSITQLPYPFSFQQEQVRAAQQQSQMAQAQYSQMMAQQPPPQPAMPGMPPAPAPQVPPPPPPIPPEQLAMLALPSMDAAVGVLRDQFERQYRIDIETNSTIDLEATEDKADVSDFMNAFGQMMAGFQPLLEEGILAFPLIKQIIMEVTRKYRFGREIEDALEQMQPPPPKKPEDDGKDATIAGLKMQLQNQQQLAQLSDKSGDIQLQARDLDAQQETNRALKQVLDMQSALNQAAQERREDAIRAAQREFDLKRDFAAKGQRQELGLAMREITQHVHNALTAHKAATTVQVTNAKAAQDVTKANFETAQAKADAASARSARPTDTDGE